MSVERFWIGKNIDYAKLWAEFDKGKGYIEKYYSMRSHLVTFEFNTPHGHPLFDFEATHKTIKGLYHDIKRDTLSRQEYERSGPLFLYSVKRGSSIQQWVGELRAIISMMLFHKECKRGLELDNRQKEINVKLGEKDIELKDQDVISKRIGNFEQLMETVRKYDTPLSGQDIQRILTIDYPRMEEGMKRLIEAGLDKISVSTSPVDPERGPEESDTFVSL